MGSDEEESDAYSMGSDCGDIEEHNATVDDLGLNASISESVRQSIVRGATGGMASR